MRLDGILQRPLPRGVAAFVRPPANDNRSFAERVKADIAEAALAAGVVYSERELARLAADAIGVATRLLETFPP